MCGNRENPFDRIRLQRLQHRVNRNGPTTPTSRSAILVSTDIFLDTILATPTCQIKTVCTGHLLQDACRRGLAQAHGHCCTPDIQGLLNAPAGPKDRLWRARVISIFRLIFAGYNRWLRVPAPGQGDILVRPTGSFLCSFPLLHRLLSDVAPLDCFTRLRIRALSTSSALQSAGRRRNILWAQRATAPRRISAESTTNRRHLPGA
jgi:hypothetical protein